MKVKYLAGAAAVAALVLIAACTGSETITDMQGKDRIGYTVRTTVWGETDRLTDTVKPGTLARAGQYEDAAVQNTKRDEQASIAAACAQERLDAILSRNSEKPFTINDRLSANEKEMAAIREKLLNMGGQQDDSAESQELLQEYERLYNENEEILYYDGILRAAMDKPNKYI